MAITGSNYSLQKALNRFSSFLSSSVLFTFSLLLAFVGFLDATYLTITHYKHIIPPCTVSGGGCETVLTSQFATVFGIPIAVFGALYYIALLMFLLLYQQKKQSQSLFLSLLLVSIGLFVSIVLIIIQGFVLHAFCQYCLVSEVVTFILFDTIWWLRRKSIVHKQA